MSAPNNPEHHESRPVREERRAPLPGVDEVAPGVGRIQLPISFPGLGHVNCYVLEDSDGVALIDPGLPGPSTWRHLKSELASIGVPINRVHTVVVTHSHPDHFGQVPRFKRQGAEVITHQAFRTFLDPEAETDEEDLETVTGLDDHPFDTTIPDGPMNRSTPWGGKPYQLPIGRRITYRAMRVLGRHFWGTPSPTRRVEDADVLTLGDREWVSVHTPGHTSDHLCLWSPADGVMISGDHVLPTITPHISGMGTERDPLADFFASLDRMADFDGVKTVLPAHGLAFTDLPGRADSIARHHHERLDTLRHAGGELGQGTVEQYMKRLFQPKSWGSMAESETYAHLKHLVLEGEAEVHTESTQLRFSMND